MSHDIDSTSSLDAACEGTWVATTEFHTRCGSTNNQALIAADESSVELPLLVLAHEQTAGRGRGENVWSAGAGALTFSLLLDPAKLGLPSDRWASLSLATAMAVTRTVLTIEPSADVAWKWPNDVYIGQRKVCGILLEVPSSHPPRMVIGIGINVNNSMDAPSRMEEGLSATAISLSSLMGQSLDLAKILRTFLSDFQDVVSELRKDPLHLTQVWQARDFLRDRQVALKVGTREVVGKAVGVDATGAILIEVAGGKVEAFPGGVVTRYE